MSSSMTSFCVIFLVIVTVCCLADALTLIDDRNGGELDVLYLGSAKSKGRKKFPNSPRRPFDSLYRQRPRSDEDDPDGWKNPCHFNSPTPPPKSRQSPEIIAFGTTVRTDVQVLFRNTESLSQMAVALRQRYATERFGESREQLDRELDGNTPKFTTDGLIPLPGSTEEMVRYGVFDLFKKAFEFMAELSVYLQTAQWEERDLEFDINYQADYLALAHHHEYGFYHIFCRLETSLLAFVHTQYNPGEWSRPTSVSHTHEDLKQINNAVRHYRDYMFLITLSNFLNKMHDDLAMVKELFNDLDGGRRSWKH